MATATPAELRDAINKMVGRDVLTLGSDPELEVEYIPTGLLPIDFLLMGGIPRGRWTELFGNYSTLKSLICYMTCASVQAEGGVAALVDTEHAYDPTWGEALGIDNDQLVYIMPESGEEALDAVEGLVRQQVELVCWDSIAATLPKTEREKSARDSIQPARLAAFMSIMCRKVTAANSRTAMLCTNQTRINVGQMFGNPETVPGGKAMPFYSSYRIALRKGGKVQEAIKIWDGEKMVSSKLTKATKIRATLEKSKLNRPHRDTWFIFDHEMGVVDDIAFMIGVGLEHGFVVKSGKSTWKIKGHKKSFNGAAKFKEFIATNEKAYSKMEQMMWETVGMEVS